MTIKGAKASFAPDVAMSGLAIQESLYAGDWQVVVPIIVSFNQQQHEYYLAASLLSTRFPYKSDWEFFVLLLLALEDGYHIFSILVLKFVNIVFSVGWC